VLHVETGLSLRAFEELSLDEIEALNRAREARQLRELHRDADLYALMCNLHANGKRVWKREDFIGGRGQTTVEGPEAEAAIEAYWRAMGKSETRPE
jgi:hypothetical protein